MNKLKKTIVFLITAALLLTGIPTAFAATGSDGDFDWTDLTDGLVAITSYTGPGGSVVIPETLSNKIVTQINADAFKDAKTTLTSITIPATVTTLQNNVFNGCTLLNNVTFATGTQVSSIPEGTFNGCTSLKSIKIPASVESIGKDAFKGCSLLDTITYDAGELTSIGEAAFYGTKLTSVKIPASVTAIGKDAYNGLTSVTSVTFASGSVLDTIGQGAFHGTNITSVIIPASVSAIGADAFSGCAKLAKAVVYTDDATIGDDAFIPSNGFIVYGPIPSTIQTYCSTYPGTNIVFSSLSTDVGPTTITSAVSSGPNRITLTWSAADRATSYELYRSTSSSGSWGTPVITTNTSYVDTKSLTMNTTYYYKVVGYCEVVGSKYYGTYSDVVSVKPIPSAPQSVSAVSKSYNTLTIKWTPVDGMNGYEIYRSDKVDGTYKLVKTWTPPVTTKVDPKTWDNSGLTTGKTYYYKVRAFQSVTTGTGKTAVTTKTYGSYSGIAIGVPMLGQVTDLKYTILSPTSVKLTWKAVPGRTKYQVMRKGPTDPDFVKYGKATYNTYYTNNSSIMCGFTYKYKVYAYRSVSGKIYDGPASSEVSVDFGVGQVKGVTITKTASGTLKVTWSSLTGVDGYEVWRSTTSTPPGATPGSDYTKVYAGTSRYYTNSSLTPGTTYYYWVRAYKASYPTAVFGAFSESKFAIARRGM